MKLPEAPVTPQAALSLHTGHLWCCFSVWWCFNKNFKICIIFHLCSCCVSVCVLRSFRSWSGCCASCSVWPPSPRGPWSPTLHLPSAPLYVHTNMINNLQVKPHRGHVSSNHASLLSCSLSSPARWPWRQGDALPSHWWVLEKPERGCVSDRSANSDLLITAEWQTNEIPKLQLLLLGPSVSAVTSQQPYCWSDDVIKNGPFQGRLAAAVWFLWSFG